MDRRTALPRAGTSHVPGFEPTGIGAMGKGDGNFRHPLFHDRMSHFVERVHDAGGYMGIQLLQQGGMPSAPSPTFSGFLDHRGVHVMSHDEVQWVINEYIESAVIAARTGLDSIELHSNHDDIIEWFLSPLTNTRTDEYGGSYENRRRFLREITDGIRARVDRPITFGLRLALDQDMDGGYGLDECMRFMQSFEADGTVDYFNLDMGGNWGAITYLQHGMYPEAAWAQMCGEAKAATSLPVLYVGRVVHAETAEKVIADGERRHGGDGARPHRRPRVAAQDPRRPPRRGAARASPSTTASTATRSRACRSGAASTRTPGASPSRPWRRPTGPCGSWSSAAARPGWSWPPTPPSAATRSSCGRRSRSSADASPSPPSCAPTPRTATGSTGRRHACRGWASTPTWAGGPRYVPCSTAASTWSPSRPGREVAVPASPASTCPTSPGPTP